MEPDVFLECLEAALSDYRFEDVSALVDRLDPFQFDEKSMTKTLRLIRGKRRFAELEKAASLFVAAGAPAPIVKRQWAQALLDQNRVDPALGILRVLDSQLSDKDKERPEVRGLIGRGHKQLYVNTGDPHHLQLAIDAYQLGWEARDGDYRWHGINLVATAKLAQDKHIAVNTHEAADDVATKLLAEINDLEYRQVWDYGTAMEASLALGDKAAALKWAKSYVQHPDANAFELGSTLRQLREVWDSRNSPIGRALDPLIEYQLLQSEGGEAAVSESAVDDDSGFEAVFGSESYVRVEWLESLRMRLGSVARVRNRTTGEPFGTGFLVRGSALDTTWGDALVFVTNSHVVSDDPQDKAALTADKACAEFTRVEGKPSVRLGDKCFHSARTELDIWVCRVELGDDLAALDLSFYPPLEVDEDDAPQRCFVAGHAKGGELVVSLFNNALVGYQDQFVHYKSPTEGGSSGSPVFNRELDVFALHHAARRHLQANEGVLFEHIKSAIAAAQTKP